MHIKFSRFARLVFVLFICTTAAIFCVLLLFPGFPVADRRYSASRKKPTSMRETEEEHGRSAPTQSNARELFTRMMSFDKHLLERGFTDEQVECCVLPFYLVFRDMKNYTVFYLIDRSEKKEGTSDKQRDPCFYQIGNMSLLGKWLLAPEGTPPPRSNITNRSYLILIWKHGPFLERRHIRRFTKNKLVSIFFFFLLLS